MSLIGLKILWEKDKMLVTSIFSFSLNVFEGLLTQGRQKSGLCGKDLMESIMDVMIFLCDLK